ncbi:TPA: AAA family ATPase [Photobacterium damselae]
MNGKLLIRLIESAINGDSDQVKMLSNMLSSDLRSTEPELSSKIAEISSNSALRGKAKPNPHTRPLEINKTNEFIKEFSCKNNVPKPIWSTDIEISVTQTIKEHQNSDKLRQHDLEPTKSVIFTGPPGVGKTLTAKWMAHALELPLFVLDLASVMSSYLGKTGSNLKSVVDYAATTPCVLLLDEFDAIAKKRDDDSDVGELKRLVTVLLQTLDDWPSTSILIAATNHPELLDPAVWRRFEDTLHFENPDDTQIQSYLGDLTKDENIAQLFPLFRGFSYSDIKTLINRCKKYCVINDVDMIKHLTLTYASDRILDKMSSQDKKSLAKLFVSNVGLSQRQVSKILKLSRPTISKALANN